MATFDELRLEAERRRVLARLQQAQGGQAPEPTAQMIDRNRAAIDRAEWQQLGGLLSQYDDPR